MKNVMMMLAVVAVVGLVFGVAVGQERVPANNTPAPEKPAPNPSMTGTISKVDGDKVILTFKAGQNADVKAGETITVTVVTDKKTDVTLDGKIVKVSDLKEGQKATVTYAKSEVKDNTSITMTAIKLEATSAK